MAPVKTPQIKLQDPFFVMNTISFAAQILSLSLLLLLLLLQLQTTMASAAVFTGVFDHGSHGVTLVKIDEAPRCSAAKTKGAPPKPLLVAAPCDAGEYPVVVFLHGYLANNSFYSQLFEHVASHGFVVVGPQLYTISGPDTTDEINAAAAVINWLAGGGLAAGNLPPGVAADATKLTISGHSRGGKVAFALSLNHANTSLPPIAALIAVDPVDGMAAGKQTPPPILTYKPNSLHVASPAMVIGTGLGGLPRGPLFPPCAPPGVSHDEFYGELSNSPSPATAARCHLVARDYGHTDMMDDVTPGVKGIATRAVCLSGAGGRRPMRRFVGGAIVAFVKRWVEGSPELLEGIRRRPEMAPVVLSVVEFSDEEAMAPNQ